MRDSSGKVRSLEGGEIVAYGLTKTGRPYALFQRKDVPGPRTSRLITLEPLPEGSSLGLTRVYVMGAAGGFAAARHQALHRLARVARECVDYMPTYGVQEAFGVTADHLRRILTGKHPAPLKGNSKLAIERLLLNPANLMDKDDGLDSNPTGMGKWDQRPVSGQFGGPGQGGRSQYWGTAASGYSRLDQPKRRQSRRGRPRGRRPRFPRRR